MEPSLNYIRCSAECEGWSYVALLTASAARGEFVQESANGLVLPDTRWENFKNAVTLFKLDV